MDNNKRKILFVDDEADVLNGVRRSLRVQRDHWDMNFVTSGEEALKELGAEHYDALVTDMRMPGMDGAELLRKVADNYPGVVRIILSGHSDDEMTIRSADTAHQFLMKPCDVNVLKQLLERVFSLQDLLNDSDLLEFMNGLEHLPSFPEVYAEIRRALQSPNADFEEIGEIISRDLAMTTKVLKLVNSAFFGIGRDITSPKEAASYIGFDALKTLAISVGLFSQFEMEKMQDRAFDLDGFVEHCLHVGRAAAKIAESVRADKKMVNDCFLAGMLHDLGILILEQNFSEKMIHVREIVGDEHKSWVDAEKDLFGANHGSVGAYLLGLWSLSPSVVEAVALHHVPSKSNCDGFCPLLAVHVANIFASRMNAGEYEEEDPRYKIDMDFVVRAGFADRLEDWNEIVVECAQE